MRFRWSGLAAVLLLFVPAMSFLGCLAWAAYAPIVGYLESHSFEPIGFSVVRRYSNWRICAAVSVLERCIVCPVVAIPLSVYPDQNPLVPSQRKQENKRSL